MGSAALKIQDRQFAFSFMVNPDAPEQPSPLYCKHNPTGATNSFQSSAASVGLDTFYMVFLSRVEKSILHLQAVEKEGYLLAGIIGQAVRDSMPDVLFKEKSREALFNSELPDAYDAYDFLMSDRLDVYAHILNLDPQHDIRNLWLSLYEGWRESDGAEVFDNIIDHTIKLLSTHKPDTSVYLDAKAFCNSPQLNYWCRVANREPAQVRAFIAEQLTQRSCPRPILAVAR